MCTWKSQTLLKNAHTRNWKIVPRLTVDKIWHLDILDLTTKLLNQKEHVNWSIEPNNDNWSLLYLDVFISQMNKTSDVSK